MQYFTGLPVILVGFHLLGACLVWIAALRLLLATSTRQPAPAPGRTAATEEYVAG